MDFSTEIEIHQNVGTFGKIHKASFFCWHFLGLNFFREHRKNGESQLYTASKYSQITRPNYAKIGDVWDAATADMAQSASLSTQRIQVTWKCTQKPGTLPGNRRRIINMYSIFM
ncbi:hypothetical protein L5515_005194 [Caenorhabditis briggsae]|uniref:Uncharacterized protein n=1 Tax=Caenorhabditis briggsae TaxID=6238 RepID=A0AAE9ENJ4_CAEBR|nr:hypothetical protein L5515_005194 [Caenorhabditis briggsae]